MGDILSDNKVDIEDIYVDSPLSGNNVYIEGGHGDQKQDQDQDQKQDQDQEQKSEQEQESKQEQYQRASAWLSTESDSKNENDNENKNENSNETKVDVENKSDSASDSKSSAESDVENKVDVDVDVDVSVDVKTDPKDDDLIDIDELDAENLDGLLTVATDNVDQKGDNNYNVDQINNLVDNDHLEEAKVSFETDDSKADDKGSSGFTFSMEAKAEGGESKIEDSDSEITTAGRDAEAAVSGSADAVASNEAFTQSISMGSNIQFNQLDIQNNDGIDANE
jgi:hypothetical protein